MNKILFVVAMACSLAFLSGCNLLGEPSVRRAYSVTPVSAGVPRFQIEQTTDRIVEAVAQAHGLSLLKTRVDEKGQLRDKSYVRLAEYKPNLWITIHFGGLPIRVDVEEDHISHPTRDYRQLVRDLRSRLEQAGLQAPEADF
ncbi:MAG: hypothetical protein HY298_21730 [Verrucomicrobia bacterium]|nr:hypothetical protein [Verrucomicrobiota bacterium]